MAKKHVHKYYLGYLGADRVWACALSHCNHYMPNHMVKMLNGKQTICWNCNEQTTLHPINMKQERPFCDACRLGTIEDAPLSDAMRERIDEGEVKSETANIRPSSVPESIRNFIKGTKVQ